MGTLARYHADTPRGELLRYLAAHLLERPAMLVDLHLVIEEAVTQAVRDGRGRPAWDDELDRIYESRGRVRAFLRDLDEMWLRTH